MFDELPIQTLVSSRCEELALRPVELVRRCGYQNISKGLRRLERLCQGELKGGINLIRKLPSVLDVPEEVVTKAVEETQRQLEDKKEAAWLEKTKGRMTLRFRDPLPSNTTLSEQEYLDELGVFLWDNKDKFDESGASGFFGWWAWSRKIGPKFLERLKERNVRVRRVSVKQNQQG